MLDHTKPYVEKKYIDAELAGYEHKLDVKLQSLCGSGFILFAVRVHAKPYHWPTTLCESKDVVHFFALKFERHNTSAIISYYRVILKLVILHDAVKTIQNGFLFLFFKKNKNLFL